MPVLEALESVTKILGELGIEFPAKPHGKEFPGPYLARGERDIEHFLYEPYFKPSFGQYWWYGVFLGDNVQPLMKGNLFIISTKSLGVPPEHWLIEPSEEMMRQVELAAIKINPPLSLETVDGYARAAQSVYKDFPVYHPKEGIATIPFDIPVSLVELVLIDKKYLGNYPHKIPAELSSKLIPV